MAVDPRSYTVTPCTTGDDIQKRDFFDSVGKIGDLEVLSDIGLGGISDGFRILDQVSNSIRIGESVISGVVGSDTYNSTLGKIIGTARDAVNEGAQIVMDSLGLGSAVEAVANFSPEVANRAWGEAQQLYQRVKDGSLDLSDAASLLQDFQNLEILAKGIFTPSDDGRSGTGFGVTMCDPSPYATDLIAFAPKYKFLFVIEIKWNPYYAQYFKDLETAFVVKSTTRPNVNVEYEEVNMYNFKTQVPRRVQYQPMTLRFYDDNWNQAMIMWNAYLKAISPIANMDFSDQNIASSGVLEESAMDFESLSKASAYGASTHDYSASYGPTARTEDKDIFQQINLYHVYREGRLMNVYQFYNPRIENFVLDDVDMSDGSSGNEVEVSFKYDALNITTGYNVNPTEGDGKYSLEKLSGMDGRAIYPIIHNGSEIVNDNCVTKDINVAADSGIDSQVSAQEEINQSADSLLGQTSQSGIIGTVTDFTNNLFNNTFQSSGARTDAQKTSNWIHNSESWFERRNSVSTNAGKTEGNGNSNTSNASKFG